MDTARGDEGTDVADDATNLRRLDASILAREGRGLDARGAHGGGQEATPTEHQRYQGRPGCEDEVAPESVTVVSRTDPLVLGRGRIPFALRPPKRRVAGSRGRLGPAEEEGGPEGYPYGGEDSPHRHNRKAQGVGEQRPHGATPFWGCSPRL